MGLGRWTEKIKILFFILGITAGVYAQTLSSHLSDSIVALGEKTSLRISISPLQGKDVLAKPKNKLLPFHFETTSDEVIQSNDLYTRTVDFQIFEEGIFVIPPLEFLIDGRPYTTIPYQIKIYNPAHENDVINDIMNNKKVDLGWRDYWEIYKFYILLFLIVLAAFFTFLGLYKNRFFHQHSSHQPTVNSALEALAALSQKKYAEKGDYRSFYVELIEITRGFITHQYHIPATVLLTDDLIEVMKNTNKISVENEKIIEEIFLRGDWVKFAKIFPNQEIMKEDLRKIHEFVERSITDLEAEHLREMH